MQKLSTGQDATLGNYRTMAVSLFGETSPAVKFLDDKISKEKEGAEAEVIAEESQVVNLLMSLAAKPGN